MSTVALQRTEGAFADPLEVNVRSFPSTTLGEGYAVGLRSKPSRHMGERRVVLDVQARDGSRLNLVTDLPAEPLLRLTLPPAEFASPAAAFFRLSRDPANLVLDCLDPDSWLELEKTCRAGRVAAVSSGSWDKVGDGGKPAYVRQRRAIFRVSRAFQVCCSW